MVAKHGGILVWADDAKHLETLKELFEKAKVPVGTIENLGDKEGNKKYKVYILSSRTATRGINGAEIVACDLSWASPSSAATRHQKLRRIEREGQKSPVVYHYTMKMTGTVMATRQNAHDRADKFNMAYFVSTAGQTARLGMSSSSNMPLLEKV